MAIKCGVRSCNRSEKVDSCHSLCNSHRSCNYKGKYDPERCDLCRSMFTQANSGTHLATDSKANLSLLIAFMRKSTSFHQPLVRVNIDYKKSFYDPIRLIRAPSRPEKSSTPVRLPLPG